MYLRLNRWGTAVALNKMDRNYSKTKFNKHGIGFDLRRNNFHIFAFTLETKRVGVCLVNIYFFFFWLY